MEVRWRLFDWSPPFAMTGASADILILDDSQDDCELMRWALAKADPSLIVDTCRAPDEALSRLFNEDTPLPRVVFLDIDLRHPQQSGHDVLRQLRSRPRTRALPVVVITAYRDAEEVRRSYDLGANSHVQKPNGGPELSDVIGRVGVYWGRRNLTVTEASRSAVWAD